MPTLRAGSFFNDRFQKIYPFPTTGGMNIPTSPAVPSCLQRGRQTNYLVKPQRVREVIIFPNIALKMLKDTKGEFVWDQSGIRIIGIMRVRICLGVIREVKHDVYGKLLPSVVSSLYSRIKIFVFAVNSKRHFSIFV